VDYILTTPVYSDELTLARLALSHCDHFDVLRSFSPRTMILRRTPPGAGDGRACRLLGRAEALAAADSTGQATRPPIKVGGSP